MSIFKQFHYKFAIEYPWRVEGKNGTTTSIFELSEYWHIKRGLLKGCKEEDITNIAKFWVIGKNIAPREDKLSC